MAGYMAYAAARTLTRPITHAMIKNYDRGFMEYRAPQQYTNYHFQPIRVRRRYTRPYRPHLRAYSLPFYYSRGGPAYHYNRRTRNFWFWRR